MFTEGWDCNTVTHIIRIRPFMSQLLCEQVVGRGLRRASYELSDYGKFTEEVSQVLGVPFEVIPFKATSRGPSTPRVKRYHVHAIPERGRYEIRFPRVEGYTQAVRNKVAMDWTKVPMMVLQPDSIPPEYEAKGLSVNTAGRMSLSGPSKIDKVSLREYRAKHRLPSSRSRSCHLRPKASLIRGPSHPENATANLSRSGNLVRSRKNQAGVNWTGCFVRLVEPRGNSTRFSAIGFSLKYPHLTPDLKASFITL